jgi:hypothetical protein
VAERQSRASEGFDDSAPIIQIVDYPAVLVSIDGKPRLRQYGESDFQYVINSPFLIVQEPGKKTYYLYAGSETWYESGAVEGPWEVAKKVPKKVRKLEPEDEEVEADSEEDKQKSSTPPAVIVSTEPTELIVTDGAPEYAPIAGGELLVVTNTESDILVEIATQRTFVLLSGRWFAAPSTDGPWEFVAADALPGSFSQIDPDSDQGHLLTWVAGTELADEIVLEAYIPAEVRADRRDQSPLRSQHREPGDPGRHPVLLRLRGCLVCGGLPQRSMEGGHRGPGRDPQDPALEPGLQHPVRLHLRLDARGGLRGLLPWLHPQLPLPRLPRLRHRLVLQPLVRPRRLLPPAQHLGLPRPLESVERVGLRLQLLDRALDLWHRLRRLVPAGVVGAARLPGVSARLQPRLEPRLSLGSPVGLQRRVQVGQARCRP